LVKECWNDPKEILAENPNLQIRSVHVGLPDTGGLIITIVGTKAITFTIKHAKMILAGKDLWDSISAVFGGAIVTAIKMSFHPVDLCPAYLNPADLVAGERDFIMSIAIGTAGSSNVVKHSTIVKKLNKIVEQGDPQFEVILEHGEKRFGWKRFGLLCSFHTSFGKFLTSAANNTSLIDMDTLNSSTSMVHLNPALESEDNDTPSPRTDFSYTTTTEDHSNHPSRNTLFVNEDGLSTLKSHRSSNDVPLITDLLESARGDNNADSNQPNSQDYVVDEETQRNSVSVSIPNANDENISGHENVMELMTMTGRDYETVMNALTLFGDQNLVLDYLLQQQEN